MARVFAPGREAAARNHLGLGDLVQEVDLSVAAAARMDLDHPGVVPRTAAVEESLKDLWAAYLVADHLDLEEVEAVDPEVHRRTGSEHQEVVVDVVPVHLGQGATSLSPEGVRTHPQLWETRL